MSQEESGFSLVELMIALAIAGISSLALMQMSAVQVRVQMKLKDRLDLIQLKASIKARVDCEATARSICKGRGTKLLADAPLTWYADPAKRHLELLPRCFNDAVFVDYVYMKNGQLAPDPVTGTSQGPRSLFPGPICVYRHPAYAGLNCPSGGRATGYDFDTRRPVCGSSP